MSIWDPQKFENLQYMYVLGTIVVREFVRLFPIFPMFVCEHLITYFKNNFVEMMINK